MRYRLPVNSKIAKVALLLGALNVHLVRETDRERKTRDIRTGQIWSDGTPWSWCMGCDITFPLSVCSTAALFLLCHLQHV